MSIADDVEEVTVFALVGEYVDDIKSKWWNNNKRYSYLKAGFLASVFGATIIAFRRYAHVMDTNEIPQAIIRASVPGKPGSQLM